LLLPKRTSESTLAELKLFSVASSQPFFFLTGESPVSVLPNWQREGSVLRNALKEERKYLKGNKKSWKYPTSTIPKWSSPPAFHLEIQYRTEEITEIR